MITVSMEVDVHGRGAIIKPLSRVNIVNDGTGTPSRGNYNVAALSKSGRVIRTARVVGWSRNSKPPLALLRAALDALGY